MMKLIEGFVFLPKKHLELSLCIQKEGEVVHGGAIPQACKRLIGLGLRNSAEGTFLSVADHVNSLRDGTVVVVCRSAGEIRITHYNSMQLNLGEVE
jgi:hypothetical protein